MSEPIKPIENFSPQPAAEKPFSTEAMTAMIIGGVILTLSGLCTGGFALSPILTGQEPTDVFTSLPVVLMFGAIGIVPGLILYFTGRHVRRKGANWGAAIIMIVFSLPLLLLATSSFQMWRQGDGIIGIILLLIFLICAALPLFWGIAMIRNIRKNRAT